MCKYDFDEIIMQLHADPAGEGDEPGAEPPEPAGEGNEPGAEPPEPAGEGNKPPKRRNLFGDGDNADPAGKPPAEGAPEEYEFKIAEGLELPDELKNSFTAIAKEANMTQATVDKLIDMHSKLMLDVMYKADEQINAWADECEKQGLASEENLANAKLAVATFGGSEALDVLVATGAANHPAVQRMLQTIGELIKEDAPPNGNPVVEKDLPMDILFKNTKI